MHQFSQLWDFAPVKFLSDNSQIHSGAPSNTIHFADDQGVAYGFLIDILLHITNCEMQWSDMLFAQSNSYQINKYFAQLSLLL